MFVVVPGTTTKHQRKLQHLIRDHFVINQVKSSGSKIEKKDSPKKHVQVWGIQSVGTKKNKKVKHGSSFRLMGGTNHKLMMVLMVVVQKRTQTENTYSHTLK